MKVIDRFQNVSLLVVGDVMLDRYWWGDVSRISPEAPVPVVRMAHSTYTPGGAANVAANVAGLGATAHLIGVVGDDPEADAIRQALLMSGVRDSNLISIFGRQTTVKTRILAHGQQVARVDQETTTPVSEVDGAKVIEAFNSALPFIDAVILSDYSKGIFTGDVVSALIKEARKAEKPVLVDPKGKDYSKYSGATMLTPNRHEAADAAGLEFSDPEIVLKAGSALMERLELEALLITQGEDGMTLFSRNGPSIHHEAHSLEVYDVTGAGDTVIATLGVAVGAGADPAEAARIANVAAGLVVSQIGTTAVSADALRYALNSDISS